MLFLNQTGKEVESTTLLMKTAIIKYPFKFQDLFILETMKMFVDDNIHVVPVDFSEITNNTEADIILGLGKDVSKADDFKISKCSSFNNRDIEFLDHLRFSNKLDSAKCITLKDALRNSRKALLNQEDRKSETGAYSSLDINSILESYTGYKDSVVEEYKIKSRIINTWINDFVVVNLGWSKVDNSLLQKSIVEALNIKASSKENIYSNYKELREDLENKKYNKLGTIYLSNLRKEFDKLYALKDLRDRTRLSTNILKLLNTANYSVWMRIWINSLLESTSKSIKYSELWNSCDFSRPGVVINTTGKVIPVWKQMAKSEEDINFFVTPEPNTSNWSIISVYPTKNPLIESDIPYWIHVSKFLAKFSSLEDVNRYMDYYEAIKKEEQMEALYKQNSIN